MGTPAFAVPSLLALAAEHEVVAVYTQPDRPAGRGRALRSSAVKQAATDLGVTIRQPPSLRADEEASALRDLAPDVVCVAAYGLILPPSILEVPAFGCLNVHASLLPRWRGAAPIERAVLAGDAVTGVSIMRMDEGLDTGPVAATVAVDVDRLRADELAEALAERGAALLVGVLRRLAEGSVEWTPQPAEGVTYAEKVVRSDIALDPALPLLDADRRVRASTARAPSSIVLGGRRLTVVRAAPETGVPVEEGGIRLDRQGLVLGFADGALRVERVRPEGRAEMDSASYVRGARLGEDARWTAVP